MSRIRDIHVRGIVMAILVLLFFIVFQTGVVFADESTDTDVVTEDATDIAADAETDVAEENAADIAADAETDVAEENATDIAADAETDVATEGDADVASEDATDVTKEDAVENAIDADAKSANEDEITIEETIGEETIGEEIIDEDENQVAELIKEAYSDAVIIEDSLETVTVSSFEAFDDRNYEISVERLSGYNRYDTSLEIANALKKELGVSEFDNIVIATGEAYPDALAGAYLAEKNSAPIILISDATADIIIDYVKNNLNRNAGKVYILGGTGAVSERIESALSSVSNEVKRLAGSDRYGTNLAILEEVYASWSGEMAVVSGTSYADALSASGLRMPLLLAGKSLTEEQKSFLHTSYRNYYIIGGPAAISEQVESELSEMGRVSRVSGNDRYDTSMAVVEKFFSDYSGEIVVASGESFPDGVSGGALAQIKRVPLLLTSDKVADRIRTFLEGKATELVTGLGGELAFQTAGITGGNKNSSNGNEGRVLKGIDVSEWNGWIDWNAVKQDGIDFAFVRAGGRFAASGFLYNDYRAQDNINRAIQAGLKVGAYFFTQATTIEEAVQEANFLINAVKGFDITMPLVIDTEEFDGGRHNYISVSERTSIVRAFCDTISEAGFDAMIYANKYWLMDSLYMDQLSDIPVWVAEWSSNCSYPGDYVAWQYTDSGLVNGINTYVDMNYWYEERV